MQAVMHYRKALCVHRYHVYVCKDVWEVAVRPENFHDRNAVAVEKDGRIIGHLPWKVSCVCAVFLEKSGTVCCTVTGRW